MKPKKKDELTDSELELLFKPGQSEINRLYYELAQKIRTNSEAIEHLIESHIWLKP